MRKLIAFLLLSACAFAQGIGGTAGVGGTGGFGGGAGGAAVTPVTGDGATWWYATDCGASTTCNTSATIGAGHTNLALVAVCTKLDLSRTFDSVSGAGATWVKVGAVLTGNGNASSQVFVGTGTLSTGAQTIGCTLSGPSSTGLVTAVFSLYNVNQTTPVTNVSGAGAGDVSVSLADANDLAISFKLDSSTNATLSGCTSSLDLNAAVSYFDKSAHCNTSPTSTFTWSGFGATSIAVGFEVLHP